MKILIISQYFVPDITAAANRISEVARILGERGHDVEVVTSTPHKSDADEFSEVEIENVGITRVAVSKLKSRSVVAYLSQFLGFSFGAFGASRTVLKRFDCDVIWVSSPPLPIVISSILLKYICRKKIVLDVRDIWPESAVSVGKIKSGGLSEFLGLMLERAAYFHASAITCVSTHMKQHLEAKTKRPSSVVYNSIPQSDLDYISSISKKPDRNLFCYSGNLGLAQDLETLLEAFANALANSTMKQCRLRIIGDGILREKLEQLSSDLGISDKVNFVGAMPKKDALKMMLEAGTMLIPLMSSKAFRVTVPSKVFDNLALERPIISNIEGEGADILKSTGANTVVASGDVDAMANGFISVRKNWETLYKQSKDNRLLVEKRFTREKSVEALEIVFSSVVNK